MGGLSFRDLYERKVRAVTLKDEGYFPTCQVAGLTVVRQIAEDAADLRRWISGNRVGAEYEQKWKENGNAHSEPNAPHERRGHSRLSLVLYDSRARSMRLLADLTTRLGWPHAMICGASQPARDHIEPVG